MLVAGALFMEVLDGTIVAPAAPVMAGALHVPAPAVAEVISVYLLTVAALIPVSGWVTDRFGARRVFSAALAGFALASALCGASTSLGVLAAARVLQGAAGSMMVPVGRLVVLRGTEKHDIIRAIAYLTWPALLAPVGAPVLGGALTTYLSWRWIFFVNVPLGLAALPVARRIVPRDRTGGAGRLDWAGLVLVGGCLSALMEAASGLSTGSPGGPWLVLLALAGAGLGLAALAHLRRSPEPLVHLGAFATRTFRASHAGGSLFRLTVSSVPFLLPLMFEQSFGWSPVRAGSMVVFLFLGNVGIKPLTTPLLHHVTFRSVLAVSCAAEAITLVLLGMVTPTTPFTVLAALLVLSGVFRSVGFTAYNTLAFADIDQEQMRDANTLSSTLQQLAAGLGVAAGAVALKLGEAVSAGHGPHGLTAYRTAFLAMAALLVPPVAEAVRLPGHAGAALRQGAARPQR